MEDILINLLPKYNLDNEYILNVFKNIKKNKLYKSYFHGLHHSEKVFLYAYLIAQELKLDDVDLQIITDACLYHDIGRVNDLEDTFHGLNSANKIETVIESDIYKDEINLKLLKAICEGHSRDDKFIKVNFDNYDMDESYYDRYVKLYNILKDADALDRTRFKKISSIALDKEFLRISYSKTLVNFGYQINEDLQNKIDEINYERLSKQYEVSHGNKICLHGVGFDFFSLRGILEDGILSRYAKNKEHIGNNRNFNGNNGDLWISAVDINKKGVAYDLFIKNNIAIEFDTNIYHTGSNNEFYGEPLHDSRYDDEVFVFDRIPRDNIKSLIIPKELLNKKVEEFDYINGSYSYDSLVNKLSNYIVHLKEELNYEVDYEEIAYLLFEYKKLYINFEYLDEHQKRGTYEYYLKQIDIIVGKLNKEVQRWMKYALSSFFGKGDVTLEDTVLYIFNELNIEYDNYGNSYKLNFEKINKTSIA